MVDIQTLPMLYHNLAINKCSFQFRKQPKIVTGNTIYAITEYDFKEEHSTELRALELVDRIIQELDKGETPLNVYLTYEKLLIPWTTQYL